MNKKNMKILVSGALGLGVATTATSIVLSSDKNVKLLENIKTFSTDINSYESANFGPDGTNLKQKSFIADGEISKYQPSVLVGSSVSNRKEEYVALKNWVAGKSNDGTMFNNPYSNQISDSDFGLDITSGKNSNSIIVKINLNKIKNSSGDQQTFSENSEDRPAFYVEISELTNNATIFDDLSINISYSKPLAVSILETNKTEILELIKAQLDSLKTIMQAPNDAQITISEYSQTDWTFTTTESGKLNVKASIDKYYDATGTEQTQTKEFTITVNGFPQKSPIITINKSEITIPGKDQALPTSIDKEQLKQLILENKSSIFNIPYPDDLTISAIDDVEYSVDLATGTISISSITFANYNDKGAIETASKVETQGLILKGFKADTTSTEIRNLSLQGVSDILSSKYENNLDKIKQAIIDNIENPAATITVADIDLENPTANNSTGTLTTTVVIKNNKAKVNGVVKETVKIENRAFTGFKVDGTTTMLSSTQLLGVNNILPSEHEQHIDEIKRAIISRIENTNGTIELGDIEVTILSSDNPGGSITANITIKNNKAKVNGEPQATFSIENKTFTGFKQDSTSTGITNLVLQGVESILPSNHAQHLDEIKTAIIKNIQNPADGQTITNSDIELTNISFSNIDGTLTATVVINNNKAKVDGTPQASVRFENKTFTGFEIGKTTTINTDLSVTDARNILPSTYQENLEQIKRAIILKIQNPNGTINTSDIDLENVSFSNPNGTLTATVVIRNGKYKENGIVQEIKRFESKTFTGFKQDSASTTINTDLVGTAVADILPSTFDEHKEIIKTVIISKISNSVSLVNPNDIELTYISHNNVKGELKLNVVIKNFKAKENGLPKETVSFNNLTFTGFKTDTSTTSISPDLSKYHLNFLPSAWRDHEVEIKEAIAKNVNNPVSEVSASDIEIVSAITQNDYEGTLTLQIKLKNGKYKDKGMPKVEHTFPEIKFIGFEKDRYSTEFTSTVLSGVDTFEPSKYAEHINEIKTAIIANLKNTVSQVTIDDIELSEIRPIDYEGQLRAKVLIKNFKAKKDGEKQEVYNFDNQTIVFSGFAKDVSSTQVLNANLGEQVPAIAEMVASSAISRENENVLKQAIIDHALVDAAKDISINDIVLSEPIPSDAQGTLKIKVTILNFKAKVNGAPVSTVDFNDVTFSGFKLDKNTTSFKVGVDGTIDISTLVSEYLPTEKNEEYFNSPIIKSAIASFIQNGVGTITGDDITISNLVPNNAKGTMSMDVTIVAGKAKFEGEVQNKPFKITGEFSGFRKQEPTLINELGRISIIGTGYEYEEINGEKDYLKASEFYKDDSSVSKAKLAKFIFEFRNEIFRKNNNGLPSLPADFSESNIAIISGVANNSKGTLVVKFDLNNYFDENGILSTTPKSFTIEITGFAVDLLTTKFSGPVEMGHGYSKITASDYVAGITSLEMISIKNKIITQKKIINYVGYLSENNKDNVPLTENDIQSIEIFSSNNAKGTITIKVTLVPGKAKVDGVVQNDPQKPYVFEGTLSGFLVVPPTEIKTSDISISQQLKELLPSQYYTGSKDNDRIKQLIVDNQSKIFVFPINEQGEQKLVLTKEDIVFIEPGGVVVEDEKGRITVNFRLNRFINSNGDLVDNSNSKELSQPFQITFTGFQTQKQANSTKNINKWIGIGLCMGGGLILLISMIIMLIKKSKSRDDDDDDNDEGHTYFVNYPTPYDGTSTYQFYSDDNDPFSNY